MDPRDYDRIADLLMQIRAKYSVLGVQKLSRARMDADTYDGMMDALDLIEILLILNDNLGELDGKGLLR